MAGSRCSSGVLLAFSSRVVPSSAVGAEALALELAPQPMAVVVRHYGAVRTATETGEVREEGAQKKFCGKDALRWARTWPTREPSLLITWNGLAARLNSQPSSKVEQEHLFK